MKEDIKEVLLDKDAIQERVTEIGKEIDEHYKGREIIIITLLDGAIVFARPYSKPSDPTIRLSESFKLANSTNPKPHQEFCPLKSDVTNKHVVMWTISLITGIHFKVLPMIISKNPVSVHTCVFLYNRLKAKWIQS